LRQCAGFSKSLSIMTTLSILSINVVVTVVSILLIDRLGRRVLHLAGSTAMLVSLLGLIAVVEMIVMCFSQHNYYKDNSTNFLQNRGFAEVKYFPLVFMITFTIGFAIGPSKT